MADCVYDCGYGCDECPMNDSDGDSDCTNQCPDNSDD